jgi:hypothetical protein
VDAVKRRLHRICPVALSGASASSVYGHIAPCSTLFFDARATQKSSPIPLATDSNALFKNGLENRPLFSTLIAGAVAFTQNGNAESKKAPPRRGPCCSNQVAAPITAL